MGLEPKFHLFWMRLDQLDDGATLWELPFEYGIIEPSSKGRPHFSIQQPPSGELGIRTLGYPNGTSFTSPVLNL